MRKRFTVAALAAATLLFAGGSAAVAEETPSPSPTESAATPTQLERVSAYTQPSVVYIGITWTGYVWDTYNKLYLNNGDPFELTFQCTGYVVNPDGYIATAGHCVDPGEVIPSFKQTAAEWALANGYYEATDLTLDDVLGFDDYVVQNEQKQRRPDRAVTTAWSVSAGGVETGKALPARVIKWQKFDAGDGAMLKVEATNLNALPLSDDEIEIGTEVVAVGYPGSVDLVADATFTPSFKEGAVSSKKTVSNGLLTVYEISAAVSGGMSGGPTVNLKGEVVGFNSFGINSDIETQQFNFVRPVQTVRELLGDAGTTAQLSDDSQDYRDGLDAFFQGDKETAVEKLSSVVDNQPTHELAKRYLEEAEDLPDAPKADEDSGDEGGNTGLIIGIVAGVLVLALLAGVLFFLISRNKKKSSPAPAGGQQYGGPPPSPGPSYQPPMGGGSTASAPGATGTAVLTPPSPGPSDRPAPSMPPPGPSGPPPGQQPGGASAPPPPPPPVVTPPPVSAQPPATEPIPAEVDDTIFCSNCGTKGEPGQKFCKHCGTHL